MSTDEVADVPSGFVTVTSTQADLEELGGITVRVFSVFVTTRPTPTEPKLTEVAFAKPLP